MPIRPLNNKLYVSQIIEARLPSTFAFKRAKKLVRLGKPNDGGYLVPESDVQKADFLFGLGLSDDWSFEKDFRKCNPVTVVCYDPTVGLKAFIGKFISSIFRVLKPRIPLGHLITLIDYLAFFRGNTRHIQRLISFYDDENNTSIETLITGTDAQNIFFKIDIEGAEYRILNQLIAHAHRIQGVVMEFHDCDLHLDKIESFIETFPLKPVHIHANNYAPVSPDANLPLVLEITFSKHAELDNIEIERHVADMPNNPEAPEILIAYSGNENR